MHSSPPSTTATRMAAVCAHEPGLSAETLLHPSSSYRLPVGPFCFVHARQHGAQQHRRRQRRGGMRGRAQRRYEQRRCEAAAKQRTDWRRPRLRPPPRRRRAPRAVPGKQQRLRLAGGPARRRGIRRAQVVELQRSVPPC